MFCCVYFLGQKLVLLTKWRPAGYKRQKPMLFATSKIRTSDPDGTPALETKQTLQLALYITSQNVDIGVRTELCIRHL